MHIHSRIQHIKDAFISLTTSDALRIVGQVVQETARQEREVMSWVEPKDVLDGGRFGGDEPEAWKKLASKAGLNHALAVPGMLEPKWRVFIENGAVVGISGLRPMISRQEANLTAIVLAGAQAQKLADFLVKNKSYPACLELEVARGRPGHDWKALKKRFPRKGVSCVMDFALQNGTPVLVQAGAAATPVGGSDLAGFHERGSPQGVALLTRTRQGIEAVQLSWKEVVAEYKALRQAQKPLALSL